MVYIYMVVCLLLTVSACMATWGSLWFTLLIIERRHSFGLQQNDRNKQFEDKKFQQHSLKMFCNKHHFKCLLVNFVFLGSISIAVFVCFTMPDKCVCVWGLIRRRQLTNPVRDCPILSHMSRMRPQSSAVFISLVAFSAEKKHNDKHT